MEPIHVQLQLCEPHRLITSSPHRLIASPHRSSHHLIASSPRRLVASSLHRSSHRLIISSPRARRLVARLVASLLALVASLAAQAASSHPRHLASSPGIVASLPHRRLANPPVCRWITLSSCISTWSHCNNAMLLRVGFMSPEEHMHIESDCVCKWMNWCVAAVAHQRSPLYECTFKPVF